MRRTFPVIALLALASAAAGQGPTAPSAAAQPTTVPSIVDELRRVYGPYMTQDTWGFPVKILSLRGGVYKFWRGSKDDFFAWSKAQRPDWYADPTSFVLQHADIHLGNTGTYVTDYRTAALAYGLIDFDDSVSAPAPIEPLECLITLRELAADKFIGQTPEQSSTADAAFAAAYGEALRSGKSANDLLQGDPWVTELLKKGGKTKAYAKLLTKLTADGKFIPVRASDTPGAPPKELLIPMEQAGGPSRQEIAAALAATAAQPGMRPLFAASTPEEFQRAIKDACRRVHLTSAGSQGQQKYFVLLDKSAATLGTDVIVYLKQEIPTAGERALHLPPSAQNAGERLVRDAAALSSPPIAGYGWTHIRSDDFLVTLHEPWSDEGDPDIVGTPGDLLHAARILGISAGASHGALTLAQRANLEKLVGPGGFDDLRRLADQYAARLKSRFEAFVADPQSEALARQALDAGEAFAHAHP